MPGQCINYMLLMLGISRMYYYYLQSDFYKYRNLKWAIRKCKSGRIFARNQERKL
jgi:hypothetical protein